jgi:3D (Asp-Asp-Asp) domain-containing protein
MFKKYIVGFIIFFCFLIFASFISFYIVSKAVSPEVVPFDDSQDFSFEPINEEGLYSEVTPNGTEDVSIETPLLSSENEKEIDKKRGIVYESEGRDWSVISSTIREVSVYNAGISSQCQGDPCISASGDNICKLLDEGLNVCAANWALFGTVLEIEGLGKCVVLDRMAERFSNNVDWAMKKNEVAEAFDFGRRNLRVSIIDK